MNAADFPEKILGTIKRHELINKGDTVIAAVSGGPDSACLLHVLFSLTAKIEFQLYAIHINHMLRGAESDADELYAAGLCKSLGIPFRAVHVDVGALARARRQSLEEAGREARYEEFERFAHEIGASSIAVAHNRNDQAETVLLHILRGSGLAGLAGMEYRRGRVIRPLLSTGRDEIEEYCRVNDLKPRTDSSNLKDDFTRNKVRLNLIPYIDGNFDTDIVGSLCRISRLAGLDNSYLDECASKEYENCLEKCGSDCIYLKLGALKALHPALTPRVLRRAVLKLKGSLKGFESKHSDLLLKLIEKGATGPVIQLPGGIRAGISYDLLKIFIDKIENPAVEFNRKIEIPGRIMIEEIGITVDAEVFEKPPEVDKYGRLGYNSTVQFFDYDLLKTGIDIRNRTAGDVFRPLGSKGTKKLKEYFIDNKTPRDIRDTIPVVAAGKEVIWITGVKTSDKFKVTENTKNVLKLEIIKTGTTTGG